MIKNNVIDTYKVLTSLTEYTLLYALRDCCLLLNVAYGGKN